MTRKKERKLTLFGKYIETLHSTGLFGTCKAEIGVDLFEAAGSERKVSEEAVKSWMDERRHCQVKRYFPHKFIDEARFIDYFKRRTKAPGTWEKFKMRFRHLIQRTKIFVLTRKQMIAMCFFGAYSISFKGF